MAEVEPGYYNEQPLGYGGQDDDEPEFMNYTPQTREEREAGKDKDALEKHRLKLRKEKFYVSDALPNPLAMEHDCPAYATEAERFNRDFARDDYEKRVAAKIAEEERIARMRTEQYYKEQDRWNEMDSSYDKDMMQQTGCQTRPIHLNNRSGDPVHTITQRYNPTLAGEELKYEDDRIKWRGEIRRQTLWHKQQSQEHNIITGAPIACPVNEPEQPQRDSYRLTAPWDK